MTFLQRIQPDVILSDITPIAFDAAAAFGNAAIAIGNFSWDWIYADYLDEYPEYRWIIQDIHSSYAKARELWRIPFYGDMSAFPNPVDVPLVARHAQAPVAQTRAKLGVPHQTSHKYVLLGLRMSDLIDVDWRRVEALQDITFVAVSRDVTLQNCIHLQEADVQFVDVLNACDAVLSKPGYSMVAEVLANRTPIVYVPRKDFVEDPVLINGLKDFGVCEELSQQDFYAGQWQETFLKLFTKPPTWQPIRTDGADMIAARILDSI